MRILCFTQTEAEGEWAIRRASSSIGRGDHYTLVLLGDTASRCWKPDTVPENCAVVNPNDLTIDVESVWERYNRLQYELSTSLPADPRGQIAVCLLAHLASLLQSLIYAEAVVCAAIVSLKPDLVLLLPALIPGRSDLGRLDYLQWLVKHVADRSGVSVLGGLVEGWIVSAQVIVSAVERALRTAEMLLWDLRRIGRWVRGSFAKRSALQSGSIADVPNPIILANADLDLSRQFRLDRLSESDVERCLVWYVSARRIAPLAAALERQRADVKTESAPVSAPVSAPAVDSDEGDSISALALRRFPMMATAVLGRSRNPWYCAVFPGRKSECRQGEMLELLGSPALVRFRLLNFRRLIAAGKIFAEGHGLFCALNPAILIGSDSVDSNRALALAARDAGIVSLCTSHAIHPTREKLLRLDPVANFHCLYGRRTYLANDDLLNVSPEYLVTHDTMPLSEERRVVRREPGDVREQRVLLLTSRYSMLSLTTWGNSLFVDEPAYNQALVELVEMITHDLPDVELVIKAHPVIDDLDFYERLRLNHPGTVAPIWREPLRPGQDIDADVAVVFNCISTVMFPVIDSGIPVIAHWGALTPVGQRVAITDEFPGSAEIPKVVELLAEILKDPNGETAGRAITRDRIVFRSFVEAPTGNLSTAIEQAARASSSGFRKVAPRGQAAGPQHLGRRESPER